MENILQQQKRYSSSALFFICNKACKCPQLIMAKWDAGELPSVPKHQQRETVRIRLKVIALVRHTKNHMRGLTSSSSLLFSTSVAPLRCCVRRYYEPFYSLVTCVSGSG